MLRSLYVSLAVFFALVCLSGVSRGQYGSGAVHLPYESQGARVAQTIGLTDVEVSYHRPGVKGRPIWGALVPFNAGKPIPWRGGANENTTISFSTDVSVEGKPLSAGTYGVHFIPSADDWTVIFSKNHTSWGSFSYKESEDALRVTVKPHTTPMEEFLTYSFVNLTPNSAALQLRWEKLAVEFTVSIDLAKTVMENIRKELRNTPGFTWQGYNSAAMFCANNTVELQQGLEWADRSIGIESRFDNLETKSRLQRLMGKTADADATLKTAMEKATPMEINSYGRELISEGSAKQAMTVFEENAQNHPDLWFVYSGLARGYEALGDLPNAIAQMKIAQSKAPDASKPGIGATIQQWEGRLKK